jgi:DHA1 family bicyclomycin/chloramphenicol resistance-like MFS transporter
VTLCGPRGHEAGPLRGARVKLSDGQIVAFVTGLVAVAQLSTSIYLPSMPAMTAEFGTDPATMQLTFTCYMMGAAFSQLVIGPLSDRFGRKPVLLVGLVIYVVATFAAALAPTIELLIAARLVQSIGATSGPVIGRAIVRDCFDRARGAQVLANVGLALALSPAIAPLIGAIVHDVAGWQANFVLVGLFGAAILLISFRWFSETNTTLLTAAGPADLARNFTRLLASRMFLAYALCSSLLFGAMFAFFSEGPFVFINVMGLTPIGYAAYSALIVVGFAIGSYVTGRATMRLGVDRMILLGIAASLAGVALLLAFAIGGWMAPMAVIVPMTIFVFGMALVFPNGTAGALSVEPEIAGTASALLGFLQMGAAALSTLAAGRLSDATMMPMVEVIAVGAALSALCYGLRFAGTPVPSPLPSQAPDGRREG